jgi:CubicO group peptidase (beta-lactamase class C family)
MSYCDYNPVPPRQLGLNRDRVEELVERAQRAVDEGPLPSVQIALAKEGRLGLFTTLGDADNSQRYNIFSCTKPLIASAIWMLMARAKVDISGRVCDYIPGFAANGKDQIIVEQLLCHTAGIPHAPMGPPAWLTRESRLEKMASWRLNWQPGTRMEYHAASAHWVLAEIIECVSGTDYRDYIATNIIAPLGLDGLQLGVPVEAQTDIVNLRSVGKPPTKAELERILGVAMEWPEISDEALLHFNEPETRALGVPGGGGVANAASVALFYQCLLHNPDQLWDPDILADATGNIRSGFVDPATGVAANRGLGVVIAGDDGMAGRRGMGKTVSARCFGHQGVGGQIAWVDPDTGISFCMLTNGLDANPIRAARFGAALSACAAATGT